MKSTYIVIGIIAAVAIILIVLVWYRRDSIEKWLNSEETKELIRSLCRQAENIITGTKKGQERLAWVVEQLKKYVPPNIAKYITTDMLIKIINIIFDQIAVVMRDGSRRAI